MNAEVSGERIKRLVKVMKVTPDEHMKVLRLIDEQTKRVNSEVSGDKIKTVEQLKFSWKKFQRPFSSWTFFSLIAPIVLVTIFAFVLRIDWNYRLDMILSMMKFCANNLCFTVFFGVLYGISAVEIEKKDIPNQGIRISVVNIVIFSIITAPLATIFFFLTYLNESFNKSLILGLLFGICFGIVRSGTPAIKHFVLRVILWSNGYIPWNYAKFLD